MEHLARKKLPVTEGWNKSLPEFSELIRSSLSKFPSMEGVDPNNLRATKKRNPHPKGYKDRNFFFVRFLVDDKDGNSEAWEAKISYSDGEETVTSIERDGVPSSEKYSNIPVHKIAASFPWHKFAPYDPVSCVRDHFLDFVSPLISAGANPNSGFHSWGDLRDHLMRETQEASVNRKSSDFKVDLLFGEEPRRPVQDYYRQQSTNRHKFRNFKLNLSVEVGPSGDPGGVRLRLHLILLNRTSFDVDAVGEFVDEVFEKILRGNSLVEESYGDLILDTTCAGSQDQQQAIVGSDFDDLFDYQPFGNIPRWIYSKRVQDHAGDINTVKIQVSDWSSVPHPYVDIVFDVFGGLDYTLELDLDFPDPGLEGAKKIALDIARSIEDGDLAEARRKANKHSFIKR